jgi:hypothetical protein
MNICKAAIKDAAGNKAGVINVAVAVIIVFMMIALIISVSPAIMAKSKLTTFADELARSCELAGGTGEETDSRAASLREQTGMSPDISWSKTGSMQLGEEFSVTLEYTTRIGVGVVSVPVHFKSTATGVSEVYHK